MRSRTWTLPILLNLLIAGSLIGALVADGIGDHLAGLVLAGVLVYAIGTGLRAAPER